MAKTQLPDDKCFIGKKIYQHIIRSPKSAIEKSAEFIKSFGGQVEQFLDKDISYILTDVPRSEWPPKSRHNTLERAHIIGVKFMSLNDLLIWCQKYATRSTGSDEDEELKAQIKRLQQPYIKFEDANCQYAPVTREFTTWPQISMIANLPLGRSFFGFHSGSSTPNPATTPNQALTPNQITSSFNNHHMRTISINNNNINNTNTNTTNNNNTTNRHGVKRRQSVYCEICSIKLNERIEEHVLSQAHRINTEKVSWTAVDEVIASLPCLSTLNNKHRLTNLAPANGIEHQEFLCLHKVDSVSQLFIS